MATCFFIPSSMTPLHFVYIYHDFPQSMHNFPCSEILDDTAGNERRYVIIRYFKDSVSTVCDTSALKSILMIVQIL